jgi:hypothetical protein
MRRVENLAITARIFTVACRRHGSVTHCADQLGISVQELRRYSDGKAYPPLKLLERAVEMILDDLPSIRREFRKEEWESLFKGP